MKKIKLESTSSLDTMKKTTVVEAKFPSNQKVKKTKLNKDKKWLKIILIIVGIFTLLTAISVYPTIRFIQATQAAASSGRAAFDAAKTQNLPAANQQLKLTHDNILIAQKFYRYLLWLKATPFFWHYTDGKHALNAAIAGVEAAQTLGSAIEPYADVLGFEGQGSFLGGAAEDRITKVVETIDKVTPALDEVTTKLEIIDRELSFINPKRYPLTIKGSNLKDLILKAKEFANTSHGAITNARPIIEVLPKVAGVEEEKQYLVMFQNDAELRATGGFMTAYAVLKINKGKVEQVKSSDIYDLDAKFNSRLKPPELIKKYLPLVFYWNLRDMNLSPDYKASMNTFYRYYRDISGEPDIDGIISVDTQFLQDIVEVLGPIEVPGYGTFSTEIDPRCDCPQIIYQLELIADRPTFKIMQGRKEVLGPMMQTILLKAYGAPKQIWPSLFQTGIQNIIEKHVLFYMFDEQAQQAAETVNIAGRIQNFDGDYFHINDTNFGGAKSNMFIVQEVDQEIQVTGNKVEKTVTIAYKNTAPASNCNLEAGELCLNGIMPNYFRLYVPQGSELTEALGFEEDSVNTIEELEKTVFEGFFNLQPQSQTKIKISYTVPYDPQSNYNLMIQKQPGTKLPQYSISLGNYFKEFELNTDKTLKIPLK